MKDSVIKGIHEAADILRKERGRRRDHGAGHLPHQSEARLTTSIKERPDANAGELAGSLNMTNGAVAQVVGKPERKGLIKRFRLKDDGREAYFRLTETDGQTYRGHVARHEKMNAKVVN
ncbi:MAG: MarR family transcriptional regulator [Deltaproteobacteria bacterium]|jgi:DNA-binding MarR family transcriptional regulator|nr:MarR family transcriptional regulator [Deltaproteobacteria bacterium]